MTRPITLCYRPMGRSSAGNTGPDGQVVRFRRPRAGLLRRSLRGRQGAGRSRLLQPSSGTPRRRHGLQVFSISNHLVGQAVLDHVDDRHKSILPAYVWGDGDPAGVNARAAEAMKDAARAAKRLGVGVVNGFTGSSIWHLLYSFPAGPAGVDRRGVQAPGRAVQPDPRRVCRVRREVRPGGASHGNRLRSAHGPAGAGGVGLSSGVRIQFRSQPFDLAGSEPGPSSSASFPTASSTCT